MPSPASSLTNDIINHIYKAGGFSWRAASVGLMDRSKGLMRTAPKKGVSDVLALHQGRLFAIEVKIGKDTLSPEQRGFLKNIEHHGGYAFVAHDLPSFIEWWNKCVEVSQRG